MPCKVVAHKGGGYDIIDPNGKVVGHSETLSKAQASCRIRNEKSGYTQKSKSEKESESSESS